LTCVNAAQRNKKIFEHRFPEEQSMLDVMLLVIGLGFFALSVGYLYACERL
jgi:hypothetical protein